MPILSELKPSGNDASLNVDDVSSNELFMSPEEQEVFDNYRQQQNSAQSTGQLPANAYYPDLNHNVAVGGYSGREIGSTTLFAPGGGLVPLGMMDARDHAINMAAAQKAKEVDDFRKQFKAPTSKLTNINEDLSSKYFGHVQGSLEKAKKKTGGDTRAAVELLKNDPEFWAKEKAFQDVAKNGDSMVDRFAQDDMDMRSGKFSPGPRYNEIRKQATSALNPDDPNFKNISNLVRGMHLERDFSDAFNDVTQKMVAEQTGRAWDNTTKNDPEFLKEWQKTVKEWSPEQKEGVAKTLEQSFFPQSDYWTPSKIKENVDYRLRGKQVDTKLNVTERRDSGTDKYTVNDINGEQSAINGKVLETGGTTRDAKYPVSDGLTFKKPVKVILPVGAKAVDIAGGGIRNMDVGNMEAEIGGVFNANTYKSIGEKDKGFDGMMLDEKNSKERKSAKVTPMVSVKYTKKNEEGDPVEVSTFVPLESIRNAVVNKDNKEAIEEIEKRAATKNASKSTAAQPAATKQGTQKATPAPKVDVNALRKKYNY